MSTDRDFMHNCAKRDWVDCPVCGESDMRREQDAEGNAIIICVNHACKSNGGDNCDAIESERVKRLVNVARGCLDYGGGYRSDAAKMECFHHGIQTVINALEAAAKNNPDDTQVAALERMGRKAT